MVGGRDLVALVGIIILQEISVDLPGYGRRDLENPVFGCNDLAREIGLGGLAGPGGQRVGNLGLKPGDKALVLVVRLVL